MVLRIDVRVSFDSRLLWGRDNSIVSKLTVHSIDLNDTSVKVKTGKNWGRRKPGSALIFIECRRVLRITPIRHPPFGKCAKSTPWPCRARRIAPAELISCTSSLAAGAALQRCDREPIVLADPSWKSGVLAPRPLKSETGEAPAGVDECAEDIGVGFDFDLSHIVILSGENGLASESVRRVERPRIGLRLLLAQQEVLTTDRDGRRFVQRTPLEAAGDYQQTRGPSTAQARSPNDPAPLGMTEWRGSKGEIV
jgi:hypothetical protein